MRLTKWYTNLLSSKEKQKFIKEINALVLTRSATQCNFLDYNEYKIIFKRYASLYFICVVDKDDNELYIMEVIHHYVEILDQYFGNVCELDIIFNFNKAYYLLDEVLLGGFFQESSKKVIIKQITNQEIMMGDNSEDEAIVTN